MFFSYFSLHPCRRRFSASRWDFFPWGVWRYRRWASRRLCRLPQRRHRSPQYACPLQQLRQTKKIRPHQRQLMDNNRMDIPPVLQTTGRCIKKDMLPLSFRLSAVALIKSPKLPLRAFRFLPPRYKQRLIYFHKFILYCVVMHSFSIIRKALLAIIRRTFPLIG